MRMMQEIVPPSKHTIAGDANGHLLSGEDILCGLCMSNGSMFVPSPQNFLLESMRVLIANIVILGAAGKWNYSTPKHYSTRFLYRRFFISFLGRIEMILVQMPIPCHQIPTTVPICFTNTHIRPALFRAISRVSGQLLRFCPEAEYKSGPLGHFRASLPVSLCAISAR